jgi:signal transduction histidine kinase
MNRNVKQCPNATVCMHDVLARVTRRIQEWLGLNRERARVARELHNALFQRLLGVSLELNHAMEPAGVNSPGQQSHGRSLRQTHHTTDEGRDARQGIRSDAIASMSLEEALSDLRDELTPRGGVRFRIFVKGQPKTVTAEIQEQICLIGREAMLNALRHAQATSIEAEVEYLPRGLRLAVRDNGCGIDPQAVESGRESHWGLLGMRERAGSIGATLRVWSRLGAGTEVEISVPSGTGAGSPGTTGVCRG